MAELERRTAEHRRVERALRFSEEKFRKAFRSSPHWVAITRLSDGRVLEAADSFLQRMGYTRAEALQRTVTELGIWDDEAERDRMRWRLEAEGAVRNFEFWFRTKAAERRLGRLSAELIDIDDETCIVAVVEDITEQRRTADALRIERTRMQQVLDDLAAVIWVKDREGRHVLVNRQWEDVLGIPRERALDRTDADLFPADRARAYHDSDALVLGSGEHIEFEDTAAPRGELLHFVVQKFVLRDAAGRPEAVCGVATDVTARKRAEARLRHDTLHDALTGLPNRVLLLERLERAMERARRHPDARCAVLFVDLDRFKLVNDSLGHAAGDELLVHVGSAIERCLRPEDTVARLGGDEFAVLVEHVSDAADPSRVAERIHAAVARPIRLGHQEVFTSASVGVTLWASAYHAPEDMLRDADTAMYRAKARGRGRTETFDAAMHARVVAQLELETDLRQAVERGEFELRYQPILAAADGRVAGLEALLRWRHPTRGLLPPSAFLAVAEDTGLILPIDAWVLEQVCASLRAWNASRRAPLVVSVNLSGRQFLLPDLPDRLAAILARSGADPRTLMLEITESALLEGGGDVTETLRRLRALNVRLSIDDFGTGYSSLAYLHQFPIDTLKIDRSFVGRMAQAGDGVEIVRTIVALAHNLVKDVIAEGVETAEQLAHLRELGCDYVQGHLFAPALDAGAAAQFVARAA
jgi:diguanylate cyclase (GGDEF)-like protein/PAS domain S-box-containing protein